MGFNYEFGYGYHGVDIYICQNEIKTLCVINHYLIYGINLSNNTSAIAGKQLDNGINIIIFACNELWLEKLT